MAPFWTPISGGPKVPFQVGGYLNRPFWDPDGPLLGSILGVPTRSLGPQGIPTHPLYP